MQYQTGPRRFDSETGVLLGPWNFGVAAPLFIVRAAAVAIASIPTLFTAAFVYARHRHRRHNAVWDNGSAAGLLRVNIKRLILGGILVLPALVALLLLRNAADSVDQARAPISQAGVAAAVPAPSTTAAAGTANPAAPEVDPGEFRRWVNDHRDANRRPLPADVLAQGQRNT